MSGWRCCLPMMAASITSAGRFSPLGPRAHLPLIEVKISGPHGAGQYLRRALSACFLDFDHYRCRVDFRLSARCGNVIESRPESINPDCSLQSKCLSRLSVSAAHAPYSHHADGNLGILPDQRSDDECARHSADDYQVIVALDAPFVEIPSADINFLAVNPMI